MPLMARRRPKIVADITLPSAAFQQLFLVGQDARNFLKISLNESFRLLLADLEPLASQRR